jgi:hypothetical protein
VVHEKRGDESYFSELAESFRRFANIRSAKANPATGSVALEFIGDLEDILVKAQEDDLLSIIEEASKASRLAARKASTKSAIHLVSGRDINRMFMVGSLFLVVGTVQVFRRELFPPAVSVLWYAMQAFRLAERPR